MDLQYEYVHPESISEDLQCCVCHEPLRSPVTHQHCGNMFCRQCVVEFCHCPVCRVKLGDLHTVPRFILNKLGELLVKCPRCSFHSRRDELERHLRDCPIRCGCGEIVSPTTLAEHRLMCPTETVACVAADVHCPWSGPRGTAVEHQKSCPFVQLRPVLTRLEDKIAVLESQMHDKEKKGRREFCSVASSHYGVRFYKSDGWEYIPAELNNLAEELSRVGRSMVNARSIEIQV